ncbi:hypothetical protein Tco_0911051 [Tanacetum coccineum]|uniref:Uncharacterized protein n=1 Tax=Tanacetum coccineum TaxID=301880 RepID=A0ABQ5CUP8_9ASTR
MNPQEKQQVDAREDKRVPFFERVKISSTNIRLETTVPQKEETFQVVIDLVMNSTCFKAFTISADVPKIFMQQLWYSIKKVQGTDSYKFLHANKKCTVNAEFFRTILDICPRVEGVYFTDVPDDDTTLTFLIDLGYKGPLKEKKSRRENMPYPRFTKIIINHFLKQHKSLTNLNYQKYHTIKDDGIMFIKYSTSQIHPKKSRGKGSQGKKIADDSQKTVDVSKDSEPEPEPVKKKTSSKGRVKKKVTLSADDNIISDEPDVALELAKSISQTEAEEAKAARQVHATHARIMTKCVPESAKKKSGGKSSKSVVIKDTLSAPKSKPATTQTKLKGTEGSNKGTSCKPGVPDESTVVSATSSEGTGIKLGVPDEEKDITKEKVILEWGDKRDSEYSDDDNDDVEKDDKNGDADDEGDDHISVTQDADDEDVKTASDEDDIYKYKIRVRKDEDKEMINAEVDDSDKGDEEITDAAKVVAENTSEVKDDPKKTELPPSSSSLSVSSGFGDQFLKLSSDSTITTLPPLSVSTTPPVPQQTTTPIHTLPITTDAPTITTAFPESNALIAVELRVAELEKDVSELKTIDHSTKALAILKFQVPSVVDNYLRSKVGDVFQKELKKHTTDLIQKYSLQQFPKSTKKQTPIVDLEQGSKKNA